MMGLLSARVYLQPLLVFGVTTAPLEVMGYRLYSKINQPN